MKLLLKSVVCFALLFASHVGQAVYLVDWSGGKRNKPVKGPGDNRSNCKSGRISSSQRLPVGIYGSMTASILGAKPTDDRQMLPQASSFPSRPSKAKQGVSWGTKREPVFVEGSHLVRDVAAMVAARKKQAKGVLRD